MLWAGLRLKVLELIVLYQAVSFYEVFMHVYRILVDFM